jgi:leucyl/phenylalanyl-tRNA--protein transferase
MQPRPVAHSPWRFDPEQWSMTSDCVAVGADLEPGTIIDAYRHGAFPMPHDGVLGWWSPALRGILRPEDLRVSRSLRKSAQRYTLTYDTDFAAVIDACADPARPGAWIDDDIRTAYLRLHELGWAHSVETRDSDGVLVGGLYGLQVGRLFAGESMFHRSRDASKVALIGLATIEAGGLIDVQWSTNHLASLGVIAVDRHDYLRRLPGLVHDPAPDWPV